MKNDEDDNHRICSQLTINATQSSSNLFKSNKINDVDDSTRTVEFNFARNLRLTPILAPTDSKATISMMAGENND
jgi:hypothetical protein